MIIYTGNNIISSDNIGAGHFHARRTNVAGSVYEHKGVDLQCVPGDKFLSPISGHISRMVRVYSDTADYKGIIIENSDIQLKILYVDCEGWKYKDVVQGEVIGLYQDISKRYPGRGPHVHYQIEWVSPLLLM